MKINEIYKELLDIARQAGITVRTERGIFRSGYCVLNDEKLIILNRLTPKEISSSVIARCLLNYKLDNMFLKPAIRDFIEREREFAGKEKKPLIEINLNKSGESDGSDSAT